MKFNEEYEEEVAQGFHYNNDPNEEVAQGFHYNNDPKEEKYVEDEKYYGGEVKETYDINYEFPNKNKYVNIIRKPVQLASKKSGFKTEEEFIKHYEKEYRNERLADTSKKMGEKYNYWHTIMSSLPKESELGREKRLLKEQNDREKKLKDSIKTHEKYVKLCIKNQNKAQRILKEKNEKEIKKEVNNEIKSDVKNDDCYTDEWINDAFILSMKEDKPIIEKTKFEIRITVNKQLDKKIEKIESKKIEKIESKKIENENEGWEVVQQKYKKHTMSTTKTKMCSSLQFGQPCKRTICNFAHTLEELAPIECSFLDNCKKGNNCKFFHPPSENKRDYCTRNSIVFEMIHEEIICLPICLSPQQEEYMSQPLPQKINVNKLYNWNNVPPPPPPQEDFIYTPPPPNYPPPPQEDYGLCMYTPQPNVKSKVCLSLKIGQPCKYGTKCNFAHTLEELTPIKCSFEFCNNGINCTYIHQNESKSDFCTRNSIVFDNDWNLVKTKVAVKSTKKTRMCSYIMLGQQCKHSICNFAHTLEELSPIECSFKDNCTKGNLCKFFHPSENKNDYLKRIN